MKKWLLLKSNLLLVSLTHKKLKYADQAGPPAGGKSLHESDR